MDDISIRKDSPFGPETVDVNDDGTGEGASETVRDERVTEPKEMGENMSTEPTRSDPDAA